MSGWIAVDIGNSAVKAGRFSGMELVETVRVPVEDGRVDLDGELGRILGKGAGHRSGVASVVPDLAPVVIARLEAVTGNAVTVVDASANLPFAVAYRTPATLGADRLAAAAAAWSWRARHRPSARVAIAVDAGTAANLEVVVSLSDGPSYLGGVIAPGPELVRRALHSGTAQLPSVPLEWPAHVVGTSTRESIQAGILPGFVYAVDGLVQQVEYEIGHPATVVVTGGWGRLLAEQLPRVDHFDPDLVLRGIREIAELSPSR